jgi:hypothetical protein
VRIAVVLDDCAANAGSGISIPGSAANSPIASMSRLLIELIFVTAFLIYLDSTRTLMPFPRYRGAGSGGLPP